MADPEEDITGLTPPAHECLDGWREVTDAYAAHISDNPDVQAALRKSVYPCKVCRPQPFYRWVQGHYAKGHDPDECEGCREVLKIKGSRRVVA